MGLRDFLPKRNYSVRKRYDSLRERADKLNLVQKRLAVLEMLDKVEPQIKEMEEHFLSNYEKKQILKEIRGTMTTAKKIMDDKDYFKPLTDN